MKSYTDLEQSKKLAEILSPESADMSYTYESATFIFYDIVKYSEEPIFGKPVCDPEKAIPCWSLAALLSVIKPVNGNTYTLNGTLDGGATIEFDEVTNVMYQREEIIDAVYEMVILLHEKGVL